MSTIGSWAPVRGSIQMLAVAGLLAVTARSSSAQQPANAAAQDTTPMTLLVVVFPDTTSAQNAMADLHSRTSPNAAKPDSANPSVAVINNSGWIEPYYAVASKAKNGKVTVKDYGQKSTSARDTRAQNTIDGVSALLEEKPSKNAAAAGAGASKAGISSANMQEIQNGLGPGTSALIVVVAEPEVHAATSTMKQANASAVYTAPLVLVPAQ